MKTRRNTTDGDEVRARLAGRKFAHRRIRTAFRVPNTEEGRRFIELAREYLNTETYTLRTRGRAENRRAKGGDKYHVALEKSEWFGIFILLKGKQAREARYPTIPYK